MLNPFLDTISNYHFSTLPNPLAGLEAHSQAITNARSELRALEFTLVTDANAANRQIRLNISNPTYDIDIGIGYSIVPASATVHYVFGVGLQAQAITNGDRIISPITPGIYLLEDYYINILIDNIQATDQISDITAYQRFWPFDQ